jgi:hypothetical protein
MKYLLHPEKFGTTKRRPRAALPVRRYLIGTSNALSNLQDYYSNPLRRGYLSSPAVDLSELGLAPPKTKQKPHLPAVPLADILAQSHAVIMSSAQKSRVDKELVETKRKFMEEITLADQHGYMNGKNRIPKRLRIKR